MFSAYLREVDQQLEILRSDIDSVTRRKALMRVQQALIAAQEIGDEKLQIVQQVQDLIENKSRQLDLDFRNLGNYFPKQSYANLNCKIIILNQIY